MVEILDPEEIKTPAPNIPEAVPDSTQLNNVLPEHQATSRNVIGEEKSMVSLLVRAPRLRSEILLLHKEKPEMLNWDEPMFKEKHREKITLVLQRLRISLWNEFEGALRNNRNIQFQQIYAGVCGETTVYKIIEDPVKLAYLICPPADYVVTLKEAHHAGLEKLREIFSARIMDDEGYLNPKAADMVIKAYALIDARLKGAIVQRIDQRTLTASAKLNEEQTNKVLGIPEDMDVLELELAKARKQINQMMGNMKKPIRDLELENIDKELELQIDYVGAKKL